MGLQVDSAANALVGTAVQHRMRSSLLGGTAVLMMVVADLAGAWACLWLGWGLVDLTTGRAPLLPGWLSLVIVCGLAMGGLYQRRLPSLLESERIAAVVSMAAVVGGIVTLAGGLPAASVLALLAIAWVNLLWVLPTVHVGMKRFLAKAGVWRMPLAAVGSPAAVRRLELAFARERSLGYLVAGRFLTGEGVVDWMSAHGITEAAVVMPELESHDLAALVSELQRVARVVHVVPDLFNLPVTGMELSYFFTERTPMLSFRNRLENHWHTRLKRGFDLIIAVCLLPVLLPVLLVLALLVRLDSPGPILFLDKRLGWHGKVFTCYKFRTMHLDNDELLERYLEQNPAAREEWERYRKLRTADPRVTRMGRILRKLSLDELPQIVNVLLGEMSLVGPRPYLVREETLMGGQRDVILQIKPGITGLWQVMGRNEIAFEERLQLESWYVRNWSLWLDGVILARTVDVVLTRRGAF